MEEPAPVAGLICFGVFEADLRAGELRRGGRKVHLQEQPFQILAMLLERPGEVVTREELRRRLWPDDVFVDFDQGLNNAIKKLRLALDDSAETPRFVETLPRRGYRFLAPVEAVDRSGRPPRRRRPSPWLAAVAVAATFVAVIYANRERWVPRARPPGRIMLAVLPFENLSGDPKQEYFSDGMTEEMIAQLGRLHPAGLAVIGRASAMHYKGTSKRADEIGRELGVDYVLSGSVRRAERQVRVTAALVRTKDQVQVWSGSVDRELRSVLEAQSDMARAIAGEIPLDLTPQERSRLPSAGPVAPEAYEAYLHGLYFFRKHSVEAQDKALTFFQEAIRRDPGYAPAYAMLVDTYAMLAMFGVLPLSEAQPKARAALAKALDLDPALAKAHEVAGWLGLMVEWDFPRAERGFQRAIDLNPNLASAHHGHGNYLAAMGRLRESLAELRRARQLDPLSLTINADVGWVLYFSREYDQAIAQCRKTIDLDPRFGPAHFFLSRAYQAKAMYGEAVGEQLEAWRLIHGEIPSHATLRQAYARSGWRGYQKKQVEALLQSRSRRDRGFADQIAVAYLHLGEPDAAFEWLGKAIDERTWPLVFLNVDPVYDPLRSDPRFRELLRRVGLPS